MENNKKNHTSHSAQLEQGTIISRLDSYVKLEIYQFNPIVEPEFSVM